MTNHLQYLYIYNPNEKDIETLPTIYGFNNGCLGEYSIVRRNSFMGVVIAEDGAFLGTHISSDDTYLKQDLGLVEHSHPSKISRLKNHYPTGYKTEFVSYSQINAHPGLTKALDNHMKRAPKRDDAMVLVPVEKAEEVINKLNKEHQDDN